MCSYFLDEVYEMQKYQMKGFFSRLKTRKALRRVLFYIVKSFLILLK